jgi:hypothetical protein
VALGARAPDAEVSRGGEGVRSCNLEGEKGAGVRSCMLHPVTDENAQLARQPDAKLRPSLSLRPQFGAGCG